MLKVELPLVQDQFDKLDEILKVAENQLNWEEGFTVKIIYNFLLCFKSNLYTLASYLICYKFLSTLFKKEFNFIIYFSIIIYYYNINILVLSSKSF